MPIEDSAVAPFARGRWLLSHNGRVDRAVLPADPLAESTCDAAILAALRLRHRPGTTSARSSPRSAQRDPEARLNLLAVNGSRILATTWGDTLSYLVTADGVVVASEPYDDDPGLGRRARPAPASTSPATACPSRRSTRPWSPTNDRRMTTYLSPSSYLESLRADVRAGLTVDAKDVAP